MMRKLPFRTCLPITAVALVLSLSASGQGISCGTAVAVTPGTYSADGPATGGGATNFCFGTGGTNADWYVYTAAADGTIDVFSCNGGADTRLSVYSGTCVALVCEDSNDDSCPTGPGGSSFASEVNALPVTAGNDYYIEWDDRWVTSAFDWTLNFNCAAAPQSSYSVNLDCANSQFFVDVTITTLGSAATVDITNTAGAPTITGVGIGTHTIGPIPLNTPVQYSVVNNTDPGCDSFSPNIEHFPCPIISCGPDNYSFCYSANMDSIVVYQSANTFALAMVFNMGTLDFGDEITIYDGADLAAPILFQGNNSGDMTGVIVTSTNPNNYLTFRINSDGFSDCLSSGGFYDPISYTVACLDCTNPGATYSVVDDCVHREFSIEVDVDSTGNASTVEIVNSANMDTLFAVGTGVTTVGPFGMDTMASVTLLNSLNPLCRQFGPDLISFVDSCTIVSCGIDNYTYCYENDDDAWYTFQRDTVANGPGPITVTFLSGAMTGPDDRVIVYNGRDDFSAVLANSNFGGNLTGQAINSTNPESVITVRFISDATISCQDGGVTQPILFDVGCGAVGVEEITSSDLLIYPNPTSDRLFLEMADLNDQNALIQVVDVMGSLVLESRVAFNQGAPVELPVGNLTNGQYLLQVISDGVFKAQRFQVTR